IAALGIRFLGGRVLPLRAALGAGLALMACFWVREGFAFLVVPFGLALVAPFWLGGMAMRRAVFLLAVFCAPALFSTGVVMVWNKYRTGDYLVAIVSQTVYLLTVLKVAEKVPGVFDGDTPLDRVARTITLKDHDYGDAQAIDEVLFRDYGIKAPELMRLAQAKYWQTVARFPGTFALTMWERLRFRQQASMLGDVLMRLDDLDWWRFVGPQKPYMAGWRADAQKFIDTRDFKYLSGAVVVNAAPRIVLRGVTLVLFVLFTFALPLIVMRDFWVAKNPDAARQAILFGSLYLLYWGIIFIYMLVSLEIRYLGPICVIPIVGSLWSCGRIASLMPPLRLSKA
ncbi:MAG: hypothetical protein NTZ72_19895, partial [Afipia sp.]|nr:hypothetical protein [Afipia sp.]